jgi:hypothetical protein
MMIQRGLFSAWPWTTAIISAWIFFVPILGGLVRIGSDDWKGCDPCDRIAESRIQRARHAPMFGDIGHLGTRVEEDRRGVERDQEGCSRICMTRTNTRSYWITSVAADSGILVTDG